MISFNHSSFDLNIRMKNKSFFIKCPLDRPKLTVVPLGFLPNSRAEFQEAKCGYVILVMAMYWTTEAVPIPVTALMPVFAFPILGVVRYSY